MFTFSAEKWKEYTCFVSNMSFKVGGPPIERSSEVNNLANDKEQLQTKAEKLLKAIRRNQNTDKIASFFVEFSGTPKSGKSTCIEITRHFFRRLGYEVLAPAEGASRRTPDYLKDDWVAFNAWSGCYALQHTLEGLYRESCDIALLDRGLFDALAWFELLLNKGEIDKKICQQVHDFFLIEHWRNTIGVVFLFKVDPETSLKRENEHTLIKKPGSAMNTGLQFCPDKVPRPLRNRRSC